MQLGSSIKSNNQCFSLNAQADGNLVIYRQSNGQALWNTATYGRNVKQTIFQSDGNLVIYNTSNNAVWASNTERRSATRITLEDNSNFVMYNAQNQALWATNTATTCSPPAPTQSNNIILSSVSQANNYFKTQYYNNQWNPDGPLSSENCGPTSVAMIFKLFGKELSNTSVQTSINRARQLMNAPMNNNIQTNNLQVVTGLSSVGLRSNTYSYDSNTLAQIDRDLADGKAVIAFGYYGTNWRNQFPSYSLTGAGDTNHINTILGKTSSGNYLVGDPLYRGGVVEMNRTQLAVFFSYNGGLHISVARQ
ncbi:C39 family peptidase [Chamaesiphon sp. GL140_3_metabinner_50]|uniref:C39 family peptidase n=1 Tax=Chamaesiphon sp. GL140_3_metabinner_50 TaxID=2970812 RepID=UPI0025DCA3B9|nr:C39 family peptidase [Chamaesiphon sp. GL140_3_metabinner_50]